MGRFGPTYRSLVDLMLFFVLLIFFPLDPNNTVIAGLILLCWGKCLILIGEGLSHPVSFNFSKTVPLKNYLLGHCSGEDPVGKGGSTTK